MPEHESEQRLWQLLGEMKASLEFLVAERKSQSERIDTHDTRLTKLEAYKMKVAGFAIGATMILTLVAEPLLKKLGLS